MHKFKQIYWKVKITKTRATWFIIFLQLGISTTFPPFAYSEAAPVLVDMAKFLKWMIMCI